VLLISLGYYASCTVQTLRNGNQCVTPNAQHPSVFSILLTCSIWLNILAFFLYIINLFHMNMIDHGEVRTSEVMHRVRETLYPTYSLQILFFSRSRALGMQVQNTKQNKTEKKERKPKVRIWSFRSKEEERQNTNIAWKHKSKRILY